MTEHISRAEWARIESLVRRAKFEFDPDWKCLIDGKSYAHCYKHGRDDQLAIIEQVKVRLSERTHV